MTTMRIFLLTATLASSLIMNSALAQTEAPIVDTATLNATANTPTADTQAVDAPTTDTPTINTPAIDAPTIDAAPVVESAAAMTKSPVDPWETYNRSMFRFNNGVDKVLLKPLAKAYVKVTPGFFRRGVDNVLSNVLEIPSILNGALQGNFRGAAHDTGRFLLNSTLGLAGILDVAQYMNLKHDDHEDFGQTLAVWGMGAGPYVILPFLGPSNLRDTTAIPVDWYTDPKTYIDHIATKNTVRAASLLNIRANILPLEKSLTGDKYVFIREAYLQRRNFLINNGVVEDSFGEEEE
jgi:phospholipid-binding lipoprotein MlaA